MLYNSAVYGHGKGEKYPYKQYNKCKMDPQLSGWPLTKAELEYISKPLESRRPGCENGGKILWEHVPYTPSCDTYNNPLEYNNVVGLQISMIDKFKKENGSCIDILLIGNSITFQWLENCSYDKFPQPFKQAWADQFGRYKTINIGIGGDKTMGALWRLDHRGAEGVEDPPLNPRLVILEIGHNNLYYTPQTGIKNAALGILWCIRNIRHKFPEAQIIVNKIFPCFTSEHRFYKDAMAVNAELDKLLYKEKDQNVHLLPDMWNEMTNLDGSLIGKFYVSDRVHLSNDGYQLWAKNLKPLIDLLLK